MRTNTILSAIALLALMHPGVYAQPAELAKPGEYNTAWEIYTQRDANVFEIELPFEVYQSATDRSLRDLAVFAKDGEPVPRLVRKPKPPRSRSIAKTQTFRLFPVMTNTRSGDGKGKLVFQQSGAETILTYDGAGPGDQSTSDSPQSLEAYVIDARTFKKRMDRLELRWPESTSPFIAQITIEGSSDLEQWRPLGQGSVAELRQDQARIVRRFVPLGNRRADYLRVTWGEVPAEWSLESVDVRYFENQQSDVVPPAQSKQMTISGRDESDGGYVFDLGGAPEVSEIQLTLPADNTVIRAAIYADTGRKNQWRRVGQQLFYHLQQGSSQIQNEPLDFSPVRARWWKLVIESGRPEIDVAMTARWRPDHLQFIAQGSGPYQLAAGRPSSKIEGFPMESKFGDASIFKVSRVTGRPQPATLGAGIIQHDPAADRTGQELPWRQWLLWFVLIAGVVAVGTMAFRLLRQLNSS